MADDEIILDIDGIVSVENFYIFFEPHLDDEQRDFFHFFRADQHQRSFTLDYLGLE